MRRVLLLVAVEAADELADAAVADRAAAALRWAVSDHLFGGVHGVAWAAPVALRPGADVADELNRGDGGVDTPGHDTAPAR